MTAILSALKSSNRFEAFSVPDLFFLHLPGFLGSDVRRSLTATK